MGEPWGSPVLNKLSIYVFALEPGNIRKVVSGERVGTLVSTS
jgi:uridylate kinase